MTRIDALIEVPGTARATFTATGDRLFYDLVTDDTMDSGSIPFDTKAMDKLTEIVTGCRNNDDRPLPDDLRSEIFIGDEKIIPFHRKLNGIIEFLTDQSSHLEFLRGFK